MAAAGQMQLEDAGSAKVTELARAGPSDEALVRAAQDGDRAAFGELYQRYARMVHGVLFARVPRAAAEDLLQDVFLQALPRLRSLRDATRFGGWLAVIARNRANDYYRQAWPVKQREDANLKRGATGDYEEEGAATRQRPDDGLFLLEVVRSLPEAYREPLVLRFVEGMTGPEIAARMGMKHGSVRVNLHRGLQMLRERLRKSSEL